MLVKNEIPQQKFQVMSDFELKVLQRVRLRIKSFTTCQTLKKNLVLESILFEEKNIFKKQDFEEKIFFKKQLLEKVSHTKISGRFNLPRKLRKFCVLRTFLKSTILKKIFFLKITTLNVNFFLKSMILNEKVFVKIMIFNLQFFVLSDFEFIFFRLIKFRINFFYNASDFKSTFLQRARF